MAKADGAIYIDTKIDVDGFTAGSKELEAAARRAATAVNGIGEKAKASLQKQADAFAKQNSAYEQQRQKVEDLKNKLNELSGQKVETDAFKSASTDATKLEQKMNALIDKQDRFVATGGDVNSKQFRRMDYDLEQTIQKMEAASAKKKELLSSGGAYKVADTSVTEQKLSVEAEKLRLLQGSLATSYDALIARTEEYSNKTSEGSAATKGMKGAIGSIIAGVRKLSSGSRGLFKNQAKVNNTMRSGVKSLLKYGIGLRSLFVLFNKLRTAIKDGFTNLVRFDSQTNKSVSALTSGLKTLKNGLATAFSPILNVVAPILTSFINLLAKAATYVGMFFASITGQSTFTKAVGIQEDYAASLEETSGAAKDAAKNLSGLDEINTWQGEKDSGGGGGGVGVTPPSDMFETVPIEGAISNIADKVKALFGKIFAPFKAAWEAQGQPTIDAARSSFDSLKGLLSSVGGSLLDVWGNGTGTETLSTVLSIYQNIATTVGRIADRLKEAWNTDSIGTGIIQNLFDLFNNVSGIVDRITSKTSDWAGNLDFGPLLSSVNNLLTALQPLTSDVGSGLSRIWNDVLLPLGQWTLEEAVPSALGLIADALSLISEVGETAAPFLQAIWDNFLQPVGEFVGDAITAFLDAFGQTLRDIAENDTAVGFLTAVAIAIGAIAVAIGAWNAAQAILNALLTANPLTIVIGAIGALIAIITLAITYWDEIKEAVQKFWDKCVSIFSGIGEWFRKRFAEVKNAIVGIWNKITDFLSGVWTRIKNIFSVVGRWFGNVFSSAWIGIKNAFSSVGSFFSGVWNGIKNAFGNVAGWFQNVFTKAWSAVKKVFSAGGKIFDGIKDGILNGLKAVINALIRGINKVISIPFDGINWALSKIRGISILGIEPFSWITTFDVPQIPLLATGAVIPPNAPFAAILGDQKRGTNIEAPLSTIEDAVENVLRRNSAFGAGGGSYRFTAQINRRTIFDEVIAEAKLRQMSTGNNPFQLA